MRVSYATFRHQQLQSCQAHQMCESNSASPVLFQVTSRTYFAHPSSSFRNRIDDCRSDVDPRMTTSSIGYTSYHPRSTSETASSLSSSSITTSSVSSDTESISSLELSPPQITIEVLENSQNVENREPETFYGRALEEADSDDSALEYQDVDIYTDEASDGGSLQWDERASISDTDAVYNFEDFEEESLSSHGN